MNRYCRVPLRSRLSSQDTAAYMMMASAAGRFGFEDISGLPWTEIDFPDDVAKASRLLPRLVA